MRIFNSIQELIHELTTNQHIPSIDCYLKEILQPVPHEIIILIKELLDLHQSTLSLLENKNPSIKQLTLREQQCLIYIIHGLTSKIIADKMNLSSRTVEGHISNIKNKFKVRTIQELLSSFLIDQLVVSSGSLPLS